MNKEFWGSRTVLVTGAGGFKGSHMVEELAKTNAKIISLIRDFDPSSYFEIKELGKKSIAVIGDLKDFRKIADILSKYEITTILHFGAQPLVTTALSHPLETLETNIMGTINVLEAARVYSKVREILIVSSDKAYGPCKRVPYTEEERLHGKAPYDVSKSCADLIAQMYACVYNMPVTIARCANVFGPGDLNKNRIVPGIMEAAVKGKVLEIRSDGKLIREYIYVKDAMDGYITLVENIERTRAETFNISSNNVLSVLEMVKKISEIIKKESKFEILNKAKYEIPEQCLNGEKIKNLIGWEAKTPFEDAIKETFEWYEKNLK